MLALSVLGLLPDARGEILSGSSVRLGGEELVGLDPRRLRKVRGGRVAMIFQEPMTSLNPVFTVGSQILESVRLHRDLKGSQPGDEVLRLLGEVGMPDPEAVARCFPHQLSGGMRQRVMIAMALAGDPDLLVADEPTTALDVTTEAQILDLLARIREKFGMSLLLISHDLGVVARVCHRVAVLYGGRVVEVGPTSQVLASPRHPYTQGLLNSRISMTDPASTLRPIPGEVPEATAWPSGCRFHPRCTEAFGRCVREEPVLSGIRRDGEEGPVREEGNREGWEARCWLLKAAGEEAQ